MAEGKYYWLKLKQDFFKRHDIKIIASMKNGIDYVVFYMKLMLESLNHDGRLRFSNTIPYNEEMLSIITETNVDIVRSAIKVFEQLKMVEILDDGTYYMHEVEKLTGSAANNDNAKRQQRYRESQKRLALSESTTSVTKNNATVTGNVTKSNERQSIEIEKEIEKDIEKETDKEREINKETETVTTSHICSCPLKEIQTLFLSICKSFPTIRSIDGSRRTAVEARWKNNPDIEIFKELFTLAESSSFLKGNNDRNWSATFDWLMKANNFNKVLEHRYDDKKAKSQSGGHNDDLDFIFGGGDNG